MQDQEGVVADPVVIAATLEVVREGLQVQRQEVERTYARTESMVRLGVAALAGVIAIVGLMTGTGVTLDRFAVMGLGIGTVGLLVSIATFVALLTGFPWPETQWIGPAPRPLLERLSDAGWTADLFRVAYLDGLVVATEHQTNVHERVVRRLSWGIAWLLFATVITACTLLFIVGGAIFA